MGTSMEFVNRICPNCKNPNYMVLLGVFPKVYKYKCMNCNRYFNDIDFEKEPLQPVWKSECMNSKVDMVEVVRCKDCKNWVGNGADIDELPYWLPCKHIIRRPDWFCAEGERQ